MSRAFSGDLRGRVLDAVEAGSSVRRAAARFGVGVSTAIRWARRWRETGERTARKQGHPIRSKLDAHEAYLLGLIEETVDITLDEMRRRLAEAGIDDPADLARLMSPVGLDIGARTPEETAISICAEIISARTGRAARPLRDTEGPIHR